VQLFKQANISILVKHPNKIRAFGRTKGLCAKTDNQVEVVPV